MIQYKRDFITVFQSELYMTTSTLVELEEAIILVDPTWLPSEVSYIQQVTKQKLNGRKCYVIYTHSDYDHIIASGAFPDATIIASEEFVHNSEKEAIIEKIELFDTKNYLTRDYVPAYPDVDIVIKEDGQKVKIGETMITFYKAKGHTDDGLFTIIESLGLFITGDYLSDVEFPFIYTSYQNYMKTMNKTEHILTHFDIKILVPGHGHVTESEEEMRQRLRDSIYYLDQLRKGGNGLEEYLTQQYPFYKGMMAMHKENQKIVANEVLNK